MASGEVRKFHEYLESLSDERRQQVMGTASGQAYLYIEAVLQQARRLRASNQVTHTEHQADALLFVHALRGLHVVADLAKRVAAPSAIPDIEKALGSFEEGLPGLLEARDALAHADEYVAGFGRRQRSGGGEYLPWFSRAGEAYTVRVGPVALEVDHAADLALELATSVLTAEYRS
jgi:hypothetical protein